MSRVTLPILDAVTMTAACAHLLEQARARVRDLEALPLSEVSPETVLDRWDADEIDLENIVGPVAILNNVHPDRTVRDAADACMRDLASFGVELFQNEALYERVRAVQPQTAAQRQLQKDLLESFEDSGVTLPPDRRARAKAIADRITELYQEFSRNIRDNPTRLTFTPEECEGLPPAWLARVPRDAEGRIVVGFDYPDFNPFMARAKDADARRRYYVAYLQRGTPRNAEILDEIVQLRRELAGLHGQASYAAFVLQRRMARTPDAVIAFLEAVKGVVEEIERRDIEQLRELKAELTGQPLAEVRLERWDVAFYSERLRERRYSIDQEAMRQYFPLPQAVEWLLLVIGRLFGVRFERAAVPVWHEEVQYYDVRDADSGAFVGGIYMDMYPRDGKYTHAAAWPVRGASRRVGRTPITVMVSNFDRRGLTHDEVETLYHEFGHVMHGLLSETTYNHHAGTNVERDFVEVPSQMFEEWARRIESLSLVREVCPECPVVDEALAGRLQAARRFGQGLQYARQHLYATYDMRLAGSEPPGAMQLWQEMESGTALGYVAETAFPGTFSHIAGGYAAAYYGYMWAEVIALDMLSAFGDNLMDADVGRRFRREILSRGGEEPAEALAQRFLGRAVDNAAFFAEIRGAR